jgi:outer membrane protein
MKGLKFVSIFAVTALIVLSGCKNVNQQNVAPESTKQSVASSGEIVYVNVDTLVSNYAMYYNLKAQFEEKSKKIENELTSKGQKLQQDARSFEEKVNKGLVTRAQAIDMQNSLQTRQNELLQYRDQKVSELGEEERVMMNQIHYSIIEYLKEFNKDYKYKMIISTSNGSPIMNADPKLNITTEVLKGLNEKYKSQEATKAK